MNLNRYFWIDISILAFSVFLLGILMNFLIEANLISEGLGIVLLIITSVCFGWIFFHIFEKQKNDFLIKEYKRIFGLN